MRRMMRRLRDLLGVDLLASPLELDLTKEDVMADLEPDWREWDPGPSAESESPEAA